MIHEALLIFLIYLINYSHNTAVCSLIFISINILQINLIEKVNIYKSTRIIIFSIFSIFVNLLLVKKSIYIDSIEISNLAILSFFSLFISLICSSYIYTVTTFKMTLAKSLLTGAIVDCLILNTLFYIQGVSINKIINNFTIEIGYRLFYIAIYIGLSELIIRKKVKNNG